MGKVCLFVFLPYSAVASPDIERVSSEKRRSVSRSVHTDLHQLRSFRLGDVEYRLDEWLRGHPVCVEIGM